MTNIVICYLLSRHDSAIEPSCSIHAFRVAGYQCSHDPVTGSVNVMNYSKIFPMLLDRQ